MILGLLQLYLGWLMLVLTIAGAVYGGLCLWKQRRDLSALKTLVQGPFTLVDYLLMGLAAAVLIFVLLTANTPEVFYDALVYHLAVPRDYLLGHGIKSMPAMFFSNFPFGIEMLYTWGLALADERVCRLLHVVFGILTALQVVIIARRFCSPQYALWAAGLFLVVPVVDMNMVVAAADVGSAFFTVLAFNGLLDWFSSTNRPPFRRAVITGVLIGMALVCKYTTAFILAPAMAFSLVLLIKNKVVFRPRLIRSLLLMAAGIMVVMLPLLVKNTLFTHNPVYPFLFKHIPSLHINPEKMQHQMLEFKEFGHRSFFQYLSQPWTLSFYYPTSNSFIGVFFLFMLPALMVMAWIQRRGPPEIQILIGSVLAALLLWSTQTQITRYTIPIIPMLCILCALVMEKWTAWHASSGTVARLAVLFLGFWGVLLFFEIGLATWDPMGAAVGLETKSAYLNRKLMNDYSGMAEAVNRLPADSKIMLFGDSRAYYYNRPVTAASVFNDHPLITMLKQGQDAQAIWNELKQKGYTHLLVSPNEAIRVRSYETFSWNEASVQTYQKLLSCYMEPVAIYRQMVLYQLAKTPLLDRPLKTGRPLFVESSAMVEKVRNLLAQAGGNRPESSLAHWEKVRELVPQWPVPYQMMGWFYYQLQRYQEAAQWYARANELGVPDARTLFLWGQCSAVSGDFTTAKGCFEKALRLQPDFSEARQGLKQVEKLLTQSKGK